MDYRDAARTLEQSLKLAFSPVAVCLVQEPPAGVGVYSGPSVPAGCVFWQEGAKGAFVTSAADHALCAVGVYTHNLADAPPTQRTELEAALKIMAELDYLREEDVARVPVAQRPSRRVLYAPLAETPLDPDVVLIFAQAGQGLVIAEAVEQVEGGAPPALGRPACSVVPQALNTGRAALSLGCCGARAYLDALTGEVALWALPGVRLGEYVARIAVLARANVTLTAFHRRRRQDVAAGEAPSVAQSLERVREGG
ncbi:DUF169 domain-containing protein [Pelomicrobium sp. G1]|uniref:DUF169 domain-containing protein n=1 Tax=unclassified Pelomicrobium TaxID=2815318 RepID=UPI003F76D7C0